MTKIDIFSGFLGAGKTTLIKKLLTEAYKGERVVLIENEFGEIGIDGGFMQEAGVELKEMNAGCICCSLVGDFGKALREVLENYKPDRILIEPSGVGKLSDVIAAVQGLQAPDLLLNACVTVADATKCRLYTKNFGEFYNNQVEFARLLVLSRTDSMNEEKLAEVFALLREKNSAAPIVTTPWDNLDATQILQAMEGQVSLATDLDALVQEAKQHAHDCACGHDHHEQEHDCACGHEHHEHKHDCACGHKHHGAEEVFQSWGMETVHRFTRDGLQRALEGLADEQACGFVLRAKGIVQSEDGTWLHFDYVPGELNLREGTPALSGRLCVIGTQLREAAVATLFVKA